MSVPLDVKVSHQGLRLERVVGGRRETELMRFRHQIFREALRWVPESVDGLDRDEYDRYSHNYAVTRQGRVVGSVRLTPGGSPFMIEREFKRLLPEGVLIENGVGSAEITRFAVETDKRGRRLEAATRLLYFCLYQWSRLNDVHRMYFVVEPRFFSHIRQLGFPAFPIGKARPLDGGVMSQAAFLDWHQAGGVFIRWLRSVPEDPVASPEQWRASGYSR